MRRNGMTLVEIIVALVLLVTVILVLGAFNVRFAQATGQAHLVVIANQLAANRLDAVRQQPTYVSVDTLANTSTQQADFSTYSLQTQVVHIGGAITDTVDYKMVTVTVTHPSMRQTITKTTAIAAF